MIILNFRNQTDRLVKYATVTLLVGTTTFLVDFLSRVLEITMRIVTSTKKVIVFSVEVFRSSLQSDVYVKYLFLFLIPNCYVQCH